MSIEERIHSKLTKRKEENALRVLTLSDGLVDFCSNDYLGLAQREVHLPLVHSGSGGSRLLSGNFMAVQELEREIAEICQSETSLFFSSGYAANVGLLSSLPQRGDVILYDQLVHASIRDGIRLSNADAYSFGHNDWEDLQKKIAKYVDREVFVVIETIYSMDGDQVDISFINALKEQYDFNLILDEAHSFGLQRPDPFQNELASLSMARVVTFGKAMGCDGAAVVCSELMKSFLINFARSFIYSTAPSPHKVNLVREQLAYWKEMSNLNQQSQKLKAMLIQGLSNCFEVISGQYGNIAAVLIPGNDRVRRYGEKLKEGGFDVRPILSPTVPKGSERLRICFHEFNTVEEVEGLISLLIKIKKEEN